MPRNVTSAGVRISRNSDFEPFCAMNAAASCAVKYWPSLVCLTFGTVLTSAARAVVTKEKRVKSATNNFFISTSPLEDFFLLESLRAHKTTVNAIPRYVALQITEPAPSPGNRSRRLTGGFRHALLLMRQYFLAAAEPPAIGEPATGDGCRHDQNLGQPEAERGQQRKRPGAELIAKPVDRGIDKTLGLVAIFAR